MRFTFVIVALLTGCPPLETKIPSTSSFEVPGEGIVGAGPLAPDQAFPSDLVGQALAQSVSSSIDTSGYDKSAVKSLKMTALKLTVVDPDENGIQVRDLGFLESLAVSLGPPDQPAILCAQSNAGDFDSNPTQYDVPLTGNELADALKAADALVMTADVQAGNAPRFATEVQVDSEMTIQFGF